MKALVYHGAEPKVIAPIDNGKILDIMLGQLAVLKVMATATVTIERGTRFEIRDIPEVKPDPEAPA